MSCCAYIIWVRRMQEMQSGLESDQCMQVPRRHSFRVVLLWGVQCEL
jgi:hypothetical protein